MSIYMHIYNLYLHAVYKMYIYIYIYMRLYIYIKRHNDKTIYPTTLV